MNTYHVTVARTELPKTRRKREKEGREKEEVGNKIGMLYVHLHFETFLLTSGELVPNFSHLPSYDLIGAFLSPFPPVFFFIFFLREQRLSCNADDSIRKGDRGSGLSRALLIRLRSLRRLRKYFLYSSLPFLALKRKVRLSFFLFNSSPSSLDFWCNYGRYS